LGWICGMYLAEGTIRHRHGKPPTDVTFSIELGEINDVVAAIERLGLVFEGKAGGKLIHVAAHKDSKTRTVTVNSKCLAGFLSDHFGFGEAKIIPDKVWKWGAPFLHGLVKGYFDGDGHYGATHEINATSTRRQFIDQLRLLLISLRYGVPTVYFAPAGKRYGRNCKDAWTIKLLGAANWKFREKHGLALPAVNTGAGKWRLEHGMRPGGRKNWRRGSEVYWCRISGVKEIEPEEFVYDLALDIEPHNYMTVNGIVHNSEFGKIATDKPDTAREIKNGALNTIAPGQKIKIESTAHGTGGLFYDMVRVAEAKMKTGQPLSQLDFKLHFFAWWMDPKYIVQPNLVIVSKEMQEYFDDLLHKHGISLTPDQKAWYVLKYQTLGHDDMHSEFPSCMEETFYNSMEGTWFKREMAKAREEHRIGHNIPHDPNYLVNTFWDIGLETKNNQNAIWFHQTDGTRHRIIDYYENVGEGIQHYATKVHEIGQRRGFTFGKHYGPHDIGHRSWASDARTRKDIAADLGIEFEVVPRVLDKEDAIEALRKMLALTWIDAEHCERLVECLDNYRKTWSKQLGQWTSIPLHNYCSNAADAGMCGAVGLKPDGIWLADGSRTSREAKKVRGSQWAQ